MSTARLNELISQRDAYLASKLGPRKADGQGDQQLGTYNPGPSEQAYAENEARLTEEWLNSMPAGTRNEFAQLATEDMNKGARGVLRKLGPMLPLVIGSLGLAAGGVAALGGGFAGSAATAGSAGAVSAAEIAGAAGAPELGLASQTGLSAATTGGAGTAAGTAAAAAKGATVAGTISDFLGGGKGLWSTIGPAVTTAAGLWNSYATGKNVQDSIDASAPARAGSMKVGDQQMALAEKNLQEQMALFEQFKPMLTDMVNRSVDASKVSTQRGNDLWNDYVSTWKPVGEEYAKKALDYASEGRMASEAARAASETKSQYDDAMTESRRSLEMAGASQEKIAALEADARLKAAKAIGGASASARREVESRGMTYLDSAARLGLNVPGLSTQQAGLSLSQTQQAQSGIGATTAAAAVPVATTNAVLNSANSAYGTASGQGLAAARGSLDNAINTNAGYGDALQAGAKLAGLFSGG